MIRRVVGLVLVLLLALQSAPSGVNSHQAKVAGGSTAAPPSGARGFLDTTDQNRAVFRYKAGTSSEAGKFREGSFDLPYAKIDRFVYGETKHLRIGQTIALSALAGVGGLLLLLSKSHSHFLSIDYRDDKDRKEVISFEVGKDAIQPLIKSLEVRTGKKIEYEAGPIGTAKQRP